jgi:sulfite reductase (NADPH) flavoprotein alpha-component
MAKDVHKALLDVIIQQGGYTEAEAEEFLVNLRKEGRYQKDVY